MARIARPNVRRAQLRTKDMAKSDVRIIVKPASYISKRRAEFEAAIREAFSESEFNAVGDNAETVAKECISARKTRKNRRTLVALDKDNSIVGAFFHIPVKRPKGVEEGEPAWFFTSPRLGAKRGEVANGLVEGMHNLMRRAGYKRIKTTMGTKAGERFLKTRHGYVPASEKPWWIKEL